MDELLIYIVKNAGVKELKTSTRKISVSVDMSQQTISRKLRELENLGLIYRSSTPNGVILKLTGASLSMLNEEYKALRHIFETSRKITGTVRPGVDQGSYYVNIYLKKFEKAIGFLPFPGTLNLQVDPDEKQAFLAGTQPETIPGFSTKERSFGSVECCHVLINSLVKGAVVKPSRATHGEGIIEVLAPVNLRKRLKLSDGKSVSLELI